MRACAAPHTQRTRTSASRPLAVGTVGSRAPHAPSPHLPARPAGRPRRATGRPAGGAARVRQVVARPARRRSRRAAAARRARRRSGRRAGPTRRCSSTTPTCSAPLDLARVAERIEDAVGRRPADHRRSRPRRRPARGHPPRRRARSSTPTPWPSTPTRSPPSSPAQSLTLARRIVEAADGCVRVIATSLDQSRRDPAADPVAMASRMVRVASEAALQHLTPREHAVVALLARTPGHRLAPARQARPATASSTARSPPACRCAVSSPARSTSPAASAFRAAPIDPETAGCAGRRAARTRPGAGGRRPAARRRRRRAGDGDGADAQRVDHRHRRAAPDAQPAGPPRTDRRTRAGAAAAARVGHPIARPGRRGGRRHRPGRDDGHVGADRRCAGGWPSSRRGPASPRAAATRPSGSPSARCSSSATVRTGRTPRAHEVLAECAATSDARDDLQRAAEHYRVAAGGVGGLRRVRPGTGLPARPRPVRALAARPLRRGAGPGRPAARHCRPVRHRALVDADGRGFVLFNANRLESAESRFMRLADLGYVHDNPRLIAVAAWGRALVASRRGDLPATLRWIGSAENTALGVADDVLGVPFLCDMADGARRPRRARAGDVVPGSGDRAPPGVPRPGRLDGVRAGGPQGSRRATSTQGLAHTLPGVVVAGEARRRQRRWPARATSRRRAGCATRPAAS